ncbi:MAG: ribbon-helix-helix domain-containing protein [Methyloligellaceae bacterium]
MTKQSINFTPPNEAWLKEKVEGKEYTSKTELVNDLIRREREREDKYNQLKQAIEYGLISGISDKTPEDIKNDVIQRLRKNGKLPT